VDPLGLVDCPEGCKKPLHDEQSPTSDAEIHAGEVELPKASSDIPQMGYHKEVFANKPIKPQQATDEWERFLGEGPYTNIHPRTNLPDPDRLVSGDGRKSIRYGTHEMNSKPTKHHYHEEVWTYELKENVMNVDNTVVRVPLAKSKK
jgi:hypothetical protein